MTPDTAVIRSVCKHVRLLSWISYLSPHILRRCHSFTSKKLYVCLDIFLCFLQLSKKRFSSRNCRLRKSFSTVIMLSTNLCHFSIGFLHDGQQNGNMERREFVEFNRRKWNKCSRFLSIFCRSSVMLVLISVLT